MGKVSEKAKYGSKERMGDEKEEKIRKVGYNSGDERKIERGK